MGLITRKELNKYMNNNINKLYNAYPIFAQIDKLNNGILAEKANFKELLSGEYLTPCEDKCIGFLFVLSGKIKIKKDLNKLLR